MTATASTTTIARIRELEDRLTRVEAAAAVLETLARYAHAIDYGDEAAWVDCFTDEGTFRVHDRSGALTREVAGREALVTFIAQHSRAPDYSHKHFALDPIVEIHGERAACSSYLLVLVDHEDRPRVRLFGRYRDRLLRGTDGRWRFDERVAEVESIEGAFTRLGGPRDPRHPVEP